MASSPHPDRFTGANGDAMNDLTYTAHQWERKGWTEAAQGLRAARWTLWDSQNNPKRWQS